MTRGDLRMALEKVRKRGLYYLPSARIVVLFFLLIFSFFFCDLNV